MAIYNAYGVQEFYYPNVLKYDPDGFRQEIGGSYGYGLIGTASYAQIRAYRGENTRISCHGRDNFFDGADGVFNLDNSDTVSLDDDGTVLIDVLNRRWKRAYSGAVNVLWFGAVPGDDSAATAKINTKAFRNACLSNQEAWELWKVSKKSRSVYVPAGDYNLSNGCSIPKGCSLYSDGVGVSRLKILGATVDDNPKLPLVSLGKAINSSGNLVDTEGAYVRDPAPFIDNIYLNPQNSNIALSIENIPGFKVGSLWIQAETAVSISGSNDGIIDDLIIEDSTVNGVSFIGAQNIIINSIYSFLCNNPVIFKGDANNIQISSLQANYTKVAVIQANDGVGVRGVKFGIVSVNQNEQFSTFASCIRLRGDVVEMSINTFDARNYNGYAFNAESGVGGDVHIGFLKLRQAPNNPSYTKGSQAKGCRVNNCKLTVDNVDIAELGFAPFEQTGSFVSTLRVEGGAVYGLNAAVPVVDISTTNSGSSCYLGVEPPSGLALFNQNAYIVPEYAGIKRPFPLVTENSRKAIKIPFTGNGSAWMLTIYANTNPQGGALYRRAQRWYVCQETGYLSGDIMTSVFAQPMGNSNLSPSFTPDISLQVDINNVGSGSQVSHAASGYAVFSVPSTYSNISYSLQQM